MNTRTVIGAGLAAVVVLISAGAQAGPGERGTERDAIECPTSLALFVAERRSSIKSFCYDRLRNEPGLPAVAKVTVDVSFDGTGKVTAASIASNNGPPALATCIDARIRGWIMPCGPRTNYPVTYEFTK
jgi:hypothetical protein